MKVSAPCPDMADAIHYYLKVLLSSSERKRIKRIDVSYSDIEEQGFLSHSNLDENGIPREFFIEIGEDLDVPVLQVIAHECVHIKQAVRSELEYVINFRTKKFKKLWKGQEWKPTRYQDDHFDSPWEIEAIGWEESLYVRYVDLCSQKIAA